MASWTACNNVCGKDDGARRRYLTGQLLAETRWLRARVEIVRSLGFQGHCAREEGDHACGEIGTRLASRPFWVRRGVQGSLLILQARRVRREPGLNPQPSCVNEGQGEGDFHGGFEEGRKVSSHQVISQIHRLGKMPYL